jgi:Fe-S cluster biogenesis protein NfuA
MRTELEGVLEPFRPGFTADGFEVSVDDLIDGIVVLRVVHKPDACEECLIPDDTLGAIFTKAFRNVAPDVTGVRIEHVRVG